MFKKSYTSFANPANSLFLWDPGIEAFDRCGSNLISRLTHQKVDFEEYRFLLERAVQEGRERQRLAKQQKLSGLRCMPPSLFKDQDLSSADVSNIRPAKSNAGRPALDPVLMFRVVFLASITKRSDQEMAQAVVSDALVRLFLRVSPGTFISRQAIWDYRELFTQANVSEIIMAHHVNTLCDQGIVSSQGPMILDGSFVEAPKQRCTRQENQIIRLGRGDKLWNDQPAKKRQKDIDARWTKKNNEVHYGYKLHALMDAASKAVICCVNTAASVHDSRVLGAVLNDEEDKGRMLYADSAYCGGKLEELVRSFNVIPYFCEKGYKNRPLTDAQIKSNNKKSKTRCRVEHAFAHIQTVFKGSFVRTIGFARAQTHI